MPTDPKWRVVARKSGQPLPCVLAVFTLMLTNASGNSAERGCLLAWDHEDAGAALDMDADDVRAIYDAMQGKVLDGDRLTGWERRQPKREDSTAAERKAAWKARKNEAERTGTHGNAPETDAETDKSIPLDKSNGAEPDVLDEDARFWADAKSFMRRKGVKQPGPLIGKWIKEHTQPVVAQALTRAQLSPPAELVPFMEGTFRQLRGGKAQDAWVSPC
jgi:hypothetical protein